MTGPDIDHRIDWRLILENLHLRWSDDVVDQAKDLRDTELRAAAGACPLCGAEQAERAAAR